MRLQLQNLLASVAIIIVVLVIDFNIYKNLYINIHIYTYIHTYGKGILFIFLVMHMHAFTCSAKEKNIINILLVVNQFLILATQ